MPTNPIITSHTQGTDDDIAITQDEQTAGSIVLILSGEPMTDSFCQPEPEHVPLFVIEDGDIGCGDAGD